MRIGLVPVGYADGYLRAFSNRGLMLLQGEMCPVVGRVSMDAVTKGVIPFMIAQFLIMFAMVLFPQLVMVPAHWFY